MTGMHFSQCGREKQTSYNNSYRMICLWAWGSSSHTAHKWMKTVCLCPRSVCMFATHEYISEFIPSMAANAHLVVPEHAMVVSRFPRHNQKCLHYQWTMTNYMYLNVDHLIWLYECILRTTTSSRNKTQHQEYCIYRYIVLPIFKTLSWKRRTVQCLWKCIIDAFNT